MSALQRAPDSFALSTLTLQFADPSVERLYADHHFEQWRRPGRIAALLGAALLAVGAVVDPLVTAGRPEWLLPARLMRAALVLYCVAVAALTWTALYRSFVAPLASLAHLLIAAACVLLLAVEGTERYVGGGLAALLVIMVSAHALSRMPLVPAFVASTGAVASFVVGTSLVVDLSPDLRLVYLLLLFTGWACALATGYALEHRTRREWVQSQLLAAERERSERLLLNILPPSIAERLKAGEPTIVDRFDDCTVLFADIVGFTPLTRSVPPAELLAMLNRVFSAFDRLARQHGLEKIKTIGDGYLAVAGLPTPRPDHTAAAAHMALDMRRAVHGLARETGWPLRLRVGLDTGGPALAGVIGTAKFAYDLWGAVVNTAARMESHGQPDAIQVTGAVRQRLLDHFHFEDRGEIDVKGIGPMRTYLLLGPATA